MSVVWPDVWAGLPSKADDTAVAEHALRFLGRQPCPRKLWTKTDILRAAVSICARRWWVYPGDVAAYLRADWAMRKAWDRMVGSGAIQWTPHQPLVFTC